MAGRERIYLDRFWDELSADPSVIDEATREHYAELYAEPHAMHDAFEQFKAFPQDGVDNRAFLAAGTLKMPVLALGGEKSYGADMATELEFVASDVKGGVHPEFRPLDHGGKPGGDDNNDRRLFDEVAAGRRLRQ